MMGDWRYTVPTGNMYGPLSGEKNMAGGDFQASKRKRNNTGQDEIERVSAFLNSPPEDKLNYIFEELRGIRVSQEQTNRGMFEFQQGFKRVNETMGKVIQVTNSNTNLLKTLAYNQLTMNRAGPRDVVGGGALKAEVLNRAAKAARGGRRV